MPELYSQPITELLALIEHRHGLHIKRLFHHCVFSRFLGNDTFGAVPSNGCCTVGCVQQLLGNGSACRNMFMYRTNSTQHLTALRRKCSLSKSVCNAQNVFNYFQNGILYVVAVLALLFCSL
jgi:hypothetical protein